MPNPSALLSLRRGQQGLSRSVSPLEVRDAVVHGPREVLEVVLLDVVPDAVTYGPLERVVLLFSFFFVFFFR